MTVPASIVVAIFFIYCDPFSQVSRSTYFNCGIRYFGNSITNGVSSLVKSTFLNNLAKIQAKAIPVKYTKNITRALWEAKKVPISRIYTGSLALHDTNEVTNMVIIRELRFSIVRVAIIAGTEQPKPIIRGINDLPCKPILCIRRSIIKAARAIYPEASSIVIQKYSINILGKNTMTAPTPDIIPSISKSLSIPSGIALRSQPDSTSTPLSIQSIGYCPSENVA